MELYKASSDVRQVAIFLAPHFEITRNQLATFPFPRIERSQWCCSYFNPGANAIGFIESDFRPRLVAHETAHYLHHHLAHKKWEKVSPYEEDLVECVAQYAEMIYLIRDHPIAKDHINEYMKEFCRNGNDESIQKKCLKAYEMILYGEEKFGNDSLYPLSQLARIIEYKEITWISQTASALRGKIGERLEELILS